MSSGELLNGKYKMGKIIGRGEQGVVKIVTDVKNNQEWVW